MYLPGVAVDRLSPSERRAHMQRIRGRDTAPELAVRRLLHQMGLRFRLHVASLPGTPDIVLPRHRSVIFVHGCFWHRHPRCKRSFLPATRQEYWRDKFERNKSRDRRVQKLLKKEGWKVLIVWECQTTRPRRARLEQRLRREFRLPAMSDRGRTRDR